MLTKMGGNRGFEANVVAIILKLVKTPYQDLVVFVAQYLCLLW